MPTERALYLPENLTLETVFSLPKRWHWYLVGKTEAEIKTTPEQKLQQAIYDYFLAAASYVAKKGPVPEIRNIGKTALRAVKSKFVILYYASDLKGDSIKLGATPDFIANGYKGEKQPHVILLGGIDGKILTEANILLFPAYYFIQSHQIPPLETMATAVWLCSQIYDLVNGRAHIDQSKIKVRADAYEAEFLNRLKPEYPNLSLSLSYVKILQDYPKGLKSLPKKAMYRLGKKRS